jgi:hypothetical protein
MYSSCGVLEPYGVSSVKKSLVINLWKALELIEMFFGLGAYILKKIELVNILVILSA